MNACSLAYFLSETQGISFDMALKAMYETGASINLRFRKTSEEGLAKMFEGRKQTIHVRKGWRWFCASSRFR